MKLGINQLMLLQRAKKKGYVTLSDVAMVYAMPNPRNSYSARKQMEKQLLILQKMELRGLLQNVGNNRFVITEKGERMLEKITKGDEYV